MKTGAVIRGTLDVVLIGAVTLGLVVMAGCGRSGNRNGGGGGGGTTATEASLDVGPGLRINSL